MAEDLVMGNTGSAPDYWEIHLTTCLLSGQVDPGRYQSAWGKPRAVILEAEILGKLNLSAWEEDRI